MAANKTYRIQAVRADGTRSLWHECELKDQQMMDIAVKQVIAGREGSPTETIVIQHKRMGGAWRHVRIIPALSLSEAYIKAPDFDIDTREFMLDAVHHMIEYAIVSFIRNGHT